MNNNTLISKDLLNLDLRQNVECIDDLLHNIQHLKLFQLNLDKIQELKNDTQFQVNMISLTLLRKYVLNEYVVGPILFRTLIEKYYPMDDNQIAKYFIKETHKFEGKTIYITNETVINRKGCFFSINEKKYESEIDLFKTDYNSDFHKNSKIKDGMACSSASRRSIMENPFTVWDWELVRDIHEGIAKSTSKNEPSILYLLDNWGFIAQLGIQNINAFFKNIKEIVGDMLSQDIIDKTKKKIEEYGFKIHSYLPLSEKFILQYRQELDWMALGMNPHIQWNLELIALYLQKIKEQQCESNWEKSIKKVSKTMYIAIEPFLNHEVLNDIEKLYTIV